jgi:hypothetical protein
LAVRIAEAGLFRKLVTTDFALYFGFLILNFGRMSTTNPKDEQSELSLKSF